MDVNALIAEVDAEDAARAAVMKEVTQDGLYLYHAVPFRRDREVVLSSVRQNGLALHFADRSMLEDHEVVMQAVRQTHFALQYVGRELKEDLTFMRSAVQANGLCLQHASPDLKGSREIVVSFSLLIS